MDKYLNAKICETKNYLKENNGRLLESLPLHKHKLHISFPAIKCISNNTN